MNTNQIASVTVEAEIIRADGSRVPLGTIGIYRRPWYKRLLERIGSWLR